MSRPGDRRGFLRGLATLPLIGGSVALIGSPVRAAEPVTDALLDRYVAWLAYEHREALVEQVARRGHCTMPLAQKRLYAPMLWYPDDPVAKGAALDAPPSTRAAIVLSAIGCNWPGRASRAG